MLDYRCEWCNRSKQPKECWILGLAAERIGATGRRREISIFRAWAEHLAGHPLAVHFCCEEHKDDYVRALFALPETRGRRKTRSHGAKAAAARTAAKARESAMATCEPPPARRRKARRPKHKQEPIELFAESDALRAHGLGIHLQTIPSE